MKRKIWSVEEINKLKMLVNLGSLSWKEISMKINIHFKNNRSKDACRVKYNKVKAMIENLKGKYINELPAIDQKMEKDLDVYLDKNEKIIKQTEGYRISYLRDEINTLIKERCELQVLLRHNSRRAVKMILGLIMIIVFLLLMMLYPLIF